jgi:hypothetical protein
MTQATLQAHRVETTVGIDGRLVLENVPFPAGESVEVIVLPHPAAPSPTPAYPLRGKPIVYHDYDPFGPAVPEEDWDALR